MSEISSSSINLNKINFNGIQKQVLETTPETVEENIDITPQINDFSNNSAEALGRSMLFKGTDDINNDLKALVENPQIAENSDEMFDIAYKTALDSGIENPYEEAANASTTSI